MQHLQPNTTLQGGKYRIERVLGQGGFGNTYLAMQTSLQRLSCRSCCDTSYGAS